jgi:hypothetical protein
VAEQRVEVRDVKARSLTIAPQQTVLGARGPNVRGWTEALVRGPLARLGLADRAQAAAALVEARDHARAAVEFEALAEELRAAEYGPAADEYLARAASAYADGQQSEAAYRIYAGLARGSLGDGEMTALVRARQAREVAPPERVWEAEALLARASWPEQGPGDEAALRSAWECSRGEAGEAEWASALVELLLLNGKSSEALEVAREARGRLPLDAGERLDLELDYLDLLEQEEGDGAAEPEWKGMIDWATDLRARPLDATARIWQRRGVALARREDGEGARRAFTQAVETWGREPGYEDQMAEAYFSSLTAVNALGDPTAIFDEARPLAVEMRGANQTATALVERLERRGLRYLLNGKHPDAFRALATAHNLARKAGNLSDFFRVTEELGDALAAAQYPVQALSAYVAAGAAKKASELADEMTVDALSEVVELASPRWQRTAAWCAIASAGRLVSDPVAATLIRQALDEIERDAPTGFPPNPTFYAADALGNLVCAAPEAERPRALELLRERLFANAGDPKHLADPLVTAMVVGFGGEESLVDAFLDENLHARIEPSLVGELAAERDELRERLAQAARGGHHAALDALAFGDLLGDDAELMEGASERVARVASSPNKEVTSEGGVQTVEVGIGASYAVEGLLARRLSPELRESLTEKLLSILADPQLPIMMRAGAVDGLHKLAPALPKGQVKTVAEALHQAAVNEHVPQDFERLGEGDLLARFKISMAPPEALRSGAVQALAVLAKYQPQFRPLLGEVVPAALSSPVEALVVAGLYAVRQHPDFDVGVPLQAFGLKPSATMRIAAYGVALASEPDASRGILAAMARDADPRVRRAAIKASADYEIDTDTIAALTEDPDCFNRALARRALAELTERRDAA